MLHFRLELAVIEGDPANMFNQFHDEAEKTFYNLYFTAICVGLVFMSIVYPKAMLEGLTMSETPAREVHSLANQQRSLALEHQAA